jgi:hypothetical protein
MGRCSPGPAGGGGRAGPLTWGPCRLHPQARSGSGCMVEVEERGWEDGGAGGELAFTRYDES